MQFMSLSEEIQVANHTFSLVNFSNHSESMYVDRVKEPHFIGEISKSIENQAAVSFEQKPILYRSKSHYHSTSLKSLKDDSGGDSGGDEEEKEEEKNDN